MRRLGRPAATALVAAFATAGGVLVVMLYRRSCEKRSICGSAASTTARTPAAVAEPLPTPAAPTPSLARPTTATAAATATAATAAANARDNDDALELSPEQLATFERDGVLVVPGVLTPEEVAEARRGLHGELRSYGVDPENLDETAHHLRPLSSTNGSGGVLNVYYPPFKLLLNEHPKLWSVVTQLWERTYAKRDPPHPHFKHGYGPFDPNRGYIYMDRVGFRVPDAVAEAHARVDPNAKKKRKRPLPLQRSLTPHLDCCPSSIYSPDGSQGGKRVVKWRPIQCFVALTDTLEADHGGFEAARGFHREFGEWASTRPPQANGRRVRPGVYSRAHPYSCNSTASHLPRLHRAHRQRCAVRG